MANSPLKAVHKQVFTDGMNTVTARENMPNNQALYQLNVVTMSSANGEVGIVTNPKGNMIVSTPLPDGENICIGWGADEEKFNFYFAVWNSEGYHTWYRFNSVERRVAVVLQNLTHTGDIDIFGWKKGVLILHCDIVRNKLIYWTMADQPPRKFNIDKAMDKSIEGYGTIIKEEYTRAYKRTAKFPPTAVYFSDNTKPFNRVYGYQFKFAQRPIYDDYEKGNWSDFSNVPLPPNEPFTGINTIPTDNNGIQITIETGSRLVKKWEIAMQKTNPEGGFLNWVIIATIDKERLGISDDSNYTYNFYNDGSYFETVIEKMIRPYSYMPADPLCQAFVKNALVYTNFHEGFDPVDLNTELEVQYEDLFLDSGTSNQLNSPSITNTAFTYDWVSGDGLFGGGKGRRNATNTIKVGVDVKKGNKFVLQGKNGQSDNLSYNYTATLMDSAATVVNQLKAKLRASLGDRIMSMGENVVDGGGNVSFTFVLKGVWGENATKFTGTVNPVSYNSLKDTGQSVNNIKLGSSGKIAIVYEDYDGRKSLAYTDDNLIFKIDPINGFNAWKSPTIELQIKHQPPEWAHTWQVVRSRDLTYDNFIQMLIQKVVKIDGSTDDEYLDLVVGSLFTYQKLHENATLRYEFAKGDRIRLIKSINIDNGSESFYPFYETEVISYKDSETQKKNENITIDGTETVTVAASSVDNVGSFLVVDFVEREIVSAPSGTTYMLDKPIATSNGEATQKLSYYEIVNRNGVIRIKKPATPNIVDFSVVEIYKPSVTGDASGIKQFFEFGMKFPVLSPGTITRAHAANGQNQSGVDPVGTPAIVKIDKGTTYVRNREMPVNNVIPGPQVVITSIEDPSYSDFYMSGMTDNGRENVEDNGMGRVHFGSRSRHSGNHIDDTSINGLNDFDNLDRKDYNDQFGDIVLTKFDMNRMYAFKTLRDTWVPIYATVIQDESGQQILGASRKLLGDMQYFAHDGGIGNHPESYASAGTMKYHVMPSDGLIVRLGGDGITPISKTYFIDNTARSIIKNAAKSGTKIHGEFDKENGQYIVSIAAYRVKVYVNTFDVNNWKLYDASPGNDIDIEILSGPTHGTINWINGYQANYESDADYIGPDSISYRIKEPGGEWSQPKNVCIDVTEDKSKAFGNTEQTLYFSKKTCLEGYTTEPVPYTMAPNLFFADTQQNANNLAIAALNEGGQDYANLHGVCYPPEVSITYSINQDYTPYVFAGLLFIKNGVEQFRTSTNGSGEVFVLAGDVVQFRQFTFPDAQPWPDNDTGVNSATLLVTKGDTELYNDTNNVQDIELHGSNYEFTVQPSGGYHIDASTNSTMTGFSTYGLEVDSDNSTSEVELIDTTTPETVINIANTKIGESSYDFNVLTNADTISVPVTNNNLTQDVEVVVTGISLFTATQIIAPGVTHTFTGVPKGGVEVLITTVVVE